MDDLITWLQAQVDEDERVARAASPGPWAAFVPNRVRAIDGATVVDVHDLHGRQRATAYHVAEWDPARVLALTGALRKILDEFSWEGRETAIVMTLAEALYADRLGYRDEWRL